MSLSKRIAILIFTTLAVLIASVFLFGGRTNAQALFEEKPSFGINTQKNELQEMESIVTEINEILEESKKQVSDIHQTKAQLNSTIEQLANEIKLLEDKIEAKRLEEARRAELARRVYTRSFTVNSTVGNTYGYGYCTWYVKNVISWVPNGWGNANQWAYGARNSGHTVSGTPIVGAVAQTSRGSLGHVAVVTAVNGSSITISEMNYSGWNRISSRTANASEFVYIYP